MADYSTYTKAELLNIIAKQEKELKAKKYGLVWDSEREPEQVVLDCENNLPILKRLNNKEIRTDDTDDNILIEGDNYHALTVLNYTHKEKIDVIYIDPPYNTGKKDFVYNDRFVEKEDGYRHSKWLNFMEKRLNIACELLTKEGVIFISIDDNEVAQLKLLSDKIFGEGNFIGQYIHKNNSSKNQAKIVSISTEYMLCYAKNLQLVRKEKWKIEKKGARDIVNLFEKLKKQELSLEEIESEIKDMYKRPKYAHLSRWNKVDEKGVFVDADLSREGGVKNYTIRNPITKQKCVIPSRGWGKSQADLIELQENDLIWYGDPKTPPRMKSYITFEDKSVPDSFFYFDNSIDTRWIKNIFGSLVFENPKPVNMLKHVFSMLPRKNITVLDFMAGSGTTGHAVLQINKEDGGKRKFILCTNNENNICTEVTYPRIKKAINGYKDRSNGEPIEGLNGNLQYFKTSLLKKTNNRDQVKINLTQKCTEMLCVKENIFNMEIEEKDFKIFSLNKKDNFLCIYYNFIEDSFNGFVKELQKLEGKKIIYMFSMENQIDNSIFASLKNFAIEAIPQNILDVYKQLVKMNIPVKPNVIFTDLNKAKTKIFVGKDKDDGARVLRVVLEKLIQRISQNNSINILNAKGKELKISTLNDVLLNQNIITKIEWTENRTYSTIGNNAAHGDYDDYDIKQVSKFYKHIQSLLNNYNV